MIYDDIRAHFEKMGVRNPAAKDSYAKMEESLLRQTSLLNEKTLFSVFITTDGVQYLYVVNYLGFVDVFVTLYSVYAGRFNLFIGNLPSGEVLGYRFHCGRHRRHLFSRFVKSLIRPWRRGFKGKTALIFGTIPNLGHQIWNECCGLLLAKRLALLPEDLRFISLGLDYLSVLQSIAGSKAIDVESERLSIHFDGQILRPSSLTIDHEIRNELLDLIGIKPESPPQGFRFCFQIRRHSRCWISELEGLKEIIFDLSLRFPDAEFFVDGHSRVGAMEPKIEDYLAGENRFYAQLRSELPSSLRIRSLIGLPIQQKLFEFAHMSVFCGPIGSGNIIPSWLMRKPFLAYGPVWMYDWVENQEKTVPEGGPYSTLIPMESIVMVGNDFEVRPSDILKQLIALTNDASNVSEP